MGQLNETVDLSYHTSEFFDIENDEQIYVNLSTWILCKMGEMR